MSKADGCDDFSDILTEMIVLGLECMCDIHPRSLPPSSFSQLSSLHKAHSLRRKKRRNMLAIFGFRKNRNQTLSNQGPEAEAEVYGDGCHTVATAPTGFVYAENTTRMDSACKDITLNRRHNARFMHQTTIHNITSQRTCSFSLPYSAPQRHVFR